MALSGGLRARRAWGNKLTPSPWDEVSDGFRRRQWGV